MEEKFKRKPTDLVTQPVCSCGKIMVWSFALRGCEYICVPCGSGVQMFHDRPKRKVLRSEHDALKLKYRDDLRKAAYEHGGASCCSCRKPEPGLLPSMMNIETALE